MRDATAESTLKIKYVYYDHYFISSKSPDGIIVNILHTDRKLARTFTFTYRLITVLKYERSLLLIVTR